MSKQIRVGILGATGTVGQRFVQMLERHPQFVVTAPPAQQPQDEDAGRGAAPADDAAGYDDGATARINVRLPEQLKAAIEEAAGREGRSVNAWLARAAVLALRSSDRDHASERRGRPGAQHHTGWAR